MAILRHVLKNNYTVITNLLLQNHDLSYEARGLLCELLSRPPNWKVRKAQLITPFCGRLKLNRIFKELKEKGYLKIVIHRQDNKISGNEWVVSDEPMKELKINPNDNKKGCSADRQQSRSPEEPPLQSNEYIQSNENPPLSPPSGERKKISRDEIEADFENWWSLYPKRCGANSKIAALRYYKARIMEGHSADELLEAVMAYQAFCIESKKVKTQFVMQASKFLGKDKHFMLDWRQMYEQQRHNPVKETPEERSRRITDQSNDRIRRIKAGEDLLAGVDVW